MPGQQVSTGSTKFLRIVGGNLVQKADKSTPGARLREYTLSNGTTGSVWELSFMNWTGTVQGIEFKDTDYGRNCYIKLEDATIALNTEHRYFSDFAKKLPSADLSKPIKFHPYDFEVDGKTKKGVSMEQGGEKLQNFFYDGVKATNGFPEVDEEERKSLGKNYWKMYFMKVEAFLVEYLKGLKIEPLQSSAEQEDPEVDSDLPF